MGEKLQTAKEVLEIGKEAGKLGLGVGKAAISSIPWLMTAPGLIIAAVAIWVGFQFFKGVVAWLVTLGLVILLGYAVIKLLIQPFFEREVTETEIGFSVGIILFIAIFGTFIMQGLGFLSPALISNAPSAMVLAGIAGAETTTPGMLEGLNAYTGVMLQIAAIISAVAGTAYLWDKYGR